MSTIAIRNNETFELKYKLDDEVYFIFTNKIRTGTIYTVEFSMSVVNSTQHVVEITYTVKFITDSGNPDKIALDESYVFPSREELLKSL